MSDDWNTSSPSSSSSSSPAGVGTGARTPRAEDFFASDPLIVADDPSTPVQAGPGTSPAPLVRPLDYSDPGQALYAVSVVRDLPAGVARERLIQQFGFTKADVERERQTYVDNLFRAGASPPTNFPYIDWGSVKGKRSKVTGRRAPTPTRPPQNPNPTPSLQDLADAGPSTATPGRSSLLDRFDQVADNVRREAAGRHRRVRNITHTNTITTVYEEDPNGAPTVRRTSTRSGPGRRNRQSSQSGSGMKDPAWKRKEKLMNRIEKHRRLYRKAGLPPLV